METCTIASWDVTHRLRALSNPSGNLNLLKRYESESLRVSGVSQFVSSLLEKDSRVICLQEVSGEQLDDLRKSLGSRVSIFDFNLSASEASSRDRAEYLVTLTDLPSAQPAAAFSFPGHPRKGVLAVKVKSNLIVCNVLCNSNEANKKQIRETLMRSLVVPFLASSKQNQAVAAGYFGCSLETVFLAVGEMTYCTGEDLSSYYLEGKRSSHHSQENHDHIIGLGGAQISDSVMFPNENLSSHQPLQVTVYPRINSPAWHAAATRSGFRDLPQGKTIA
eukprot:NODE_3161_length_1034_cov_46.881218_g2905_i0.p1 GENE.NODE_3161_length_1034_cov_46.881218_g2905_i0~~NODE_3161_length_1034_cov_46.881218_g2905_i0.p1  ORF type:complete len:277 (+),score=44.85 NODE_3161_length_1034_cov_46.881218_g2905_i0:57-887(+)